MKSNTQIMGILNCTPDSFYDGGFFPSRESLIEQALKMVKGGAQWIDVGGESTRPGSDPITLKEELERVIPVIRGLREESKVLISVDTTKHGVAEQALKAGASMVNDVSGLSKDPCMRDLVREAACPVVLMHSRGKPKDMQDEAHYPSGVDDILGEIKMTIDRALEAGIREEQILIDPGLGFAKKYEHNLQVLKNLQCFKDLGYPVVLGHSRKSFIGGMTHQKDPSNRLPGSLAVAYYAASNGIDYLRVHDVAETMDVLCVIDCLENDESIG